MAVRGEFASTRIDYDGETSSFGFRIAEITAANQVAQHALRVALTAGVNGICLGNGIKHVEANVDALLNQDPATDPLAQRENKWLVQFSDDVTGKKYKVELPCADLTKLDPNNRKSAEIGDAAEVDAFVTAFEAYALSQDGNAVTVTGITFVGRNL